MKLNLELNNQTKSPVKKSFFNAVVKKTLEEVDFDFFKNIKISVSVALVSEAEIKKLNKTYRKKNQVTDVLSFAEYKSERELRKRVEKEKKDMDREGLFLGELILCYDDIREYAGKEKINPHTKSLNPENFGVGVKLEKELAKVVAHGVLHLLGMKHGKKMFGIQDKVARDF